jgi:hypothetical protein
LNLSDREAPGEDGFEAGTSKSADTSYDQGDDKVFVKCFKDSLRSSREYQQKKLQSSMNRSYRAFQNRHMNGSKYDTARYKSRSKIFKPKTRQAVMKNLATAAQAFFSTQDVVSISPERASDKLQASTAIFLHEVLNYRLDRRNRWAGPNWFLTLTGAVQDTQIAGYCVTKQYWEYEERTVKNYATVTRQQPILDNTGQPLRDMLTGEPVLEDVEEETVSDDQEITRDRLMIMNIPAEQAYIDQTGDWRDPIQEGGFFFAGFAVRLDDVRDIINQQADRNVMGGKAWRKVDVSALTGATNDRDSQAAGVRRSRNDGIDPLEGLYTSKDNQTVWLYECFYRKDGEDWHFWMVGENTLLSDPRPTIDSYPGHCGERPYVRGVGNVETHRVYPMSTVESVQPLQNEINDVTNLGLDAMKMAISPITVVKRGSNPDLKQLQNRGPDATIFANNVDDVTFTRAPDPSSNSLQYLNILSNDFDDSAGVFSQSSVQSNRTLNETVGGMQLIAGSANAMTEFTLRVFVETWAEPTLAQCVNLIRYYESDEVVIAVAGENAGLIENIDTEDDGTLDPRQAQQDAAEEEGETPDQQKKEPPISIDQVLGHLDRAQVTVKIDVGIGALDPQQRLGKFMQAWQGTKDIAPLLAEQGIQPNGEALTQELWGLSGYKDGADRFFMKAPKKQGEGPPESVQLQQLKGQQDAEKTQANNDTKLQIEQMKQEIQNKDLMLKAQAQAHKEKMDQLDLKMQQMQNEFSNRFSQQTGSIDNMMKVVGALQKNKQITQPRPNGSAN